jgi:hypothetical protein
MLTDLGVVIDGRLTFSRQVTKVCFKVYASLYRLCLLKFLTPKRVRLKLCKALHLPYIFYCDVVFSRLYTFWDYSVPHFCSNRRMTAENLHSLESLGSNQ